MYTLLGLQQLCGLALRVSYFLPESVFLHRSRTASVKGRYIHDEHLAGILIGVERNGKDIIVLTSMQLLMDLIQIW